MKSRPDRPAFALGIIVQILGWVGVFYALAVAWVSHFKIAPFRYEGF